VRLTGFKPEFKREFGLAFGDYTEVFDPKESERSNNITVPRTEPCIALYPSANQNGSWVFYNLNTKTYVRRTQWTKLPTSKLVIAVRNELAGTKGVKLADLDVPTLQAQEAEEAQMQQPTTHVHVSTPAEMSQEEAGIVFDDDLDFPGLTSRNEDDDSISESSESTDDVSEDDEDPDDKE
jgi:hypothetical protein